MDTDHSTPVRPPATLARLGRLQRRWLLILWAALLGFWGSQLTEAPITKDAAENLAMAFSLKDQGVISSSPEPPYEKSMSREPLPAVINAANLYIIEALAGRVTYAESLTGARARTLKLQNLFWLSLLSAAIFTATFRFSGGSFVWSVATVITTSALLLLPEVGTYMLNSLCTEAPAAALLSLGSLFAAESIRRPRWPNLLGAGITFGLLSLVKASFFYVSLGLVVFTPLLLLLLRRRIVFQAAMKFSLVLALCVAAFAGPWLIRNHAHFGQWNLASRGGEALYTRAMMNDMSRREYAVALMLYSHYPLNGIFRRALGLSRDDVQNDIAVQRVSDGMNPLVEPNDLQAEMAGRPEDTITFYRRGRAEHVKLAYQMGAAGVAHPEYASDSVLIKRGLAMIAENPLNHLAYTLLWLWGDVFFTFPPLMCALALALWRRDAELLIYVLPSFGLVMFYALVSFYVPRYGLPAYPPAVAAGAILACAWLLSRANRSCAG